MSMEKMRQSRGRSRRPAALSVALAFATALSGCGLDEVNIPELDGPSTYGISLLLSVNKDVLVADGRDFAVVTATVRGPNGEAAANRDVFFAIADESGNFADIGVIVGSNGPGTGATVRTNAQGIAQVLYEAPPRNDATANQSVTIQARLVGTDFNGMTYRSVRIELRSAEPRIFPQVPGNVAPTCSFITEPAVGPFFTNEVVGFHSTSFDTDGTIIRYEWTFGDGTTGDSPDTAHVFRLPGTYVVSHTVVDDDGGTMTCVTSPGITVVSR